MSRRGLLLLTVGALGSALSGCTCGSTESGGYTCEYEPGAGGGGPAAASPAPETSQPAVESQEPAPESSEPGTEPPADSPEPETEQEVVTEVPVGPKDSGNVGNANNSTGGTGDVGPQIVDGDVVVVDDGIEGPRPVDGGVITEIPIGPKDSGNVGNANNSTSG